MENTSTIASLGMGKCLGMSWESTKTNIFLFAGFTMLYFIISAVCTFIPGLSAISNLFSFVFTSGIFSAFDAYERTRKLEFNDFFGWSPRFGRIFLGQLLELGIALLILIPLFLILLVILGVGFFTTTLSNPEDIASMFGPGLLIGVLVFLLLCLLLGVWLFAYSFIIQFTDMSYSEALGLSWKIGRNNVGHLIVFILLAMGLSILGFICLGIGLTVTTPLILGAQYYFLKSLFATEHTQKWDFMQPQETL